MIFDCDGTLADTMPAHYRTWKETLLRHGIPLSRERFLQVSGLEEIPESWSRLLAGEGI